MARRGSHLPELPPAGPVRAGGVTLNVRRLAPGRVPPPGSGASRAGPSPPWVIVLHGGPGLDHHLLLPLGLALAEDYEVWLPDLPGHGASPPAEGDPPPSLRRLEEGLRRWMAGLSGAPRALVGHSLGAWLVRELLDRAAPGPRVEPDAAVLLAPPAAGQARSATALRRMASVTGRDRRGRGGGRRGAARARREVRAHVEAETGGRASPAFLEALDRARIRDPRGYGELTRQLHRRLVAPVQPAAAPCPVLVLCGEEDRTTPPEQAARVAEALGTARLELLPGAGHYPFADAPDETARAVRAFLDPLLL